MKNFISGKSTRIVPPYKSDSETSGFTLTNLSFNFLSVMDPGPGKDILSLSQNVFAIGHKEGVLMSSTYILHKLYLFGAGNTIDLRKVRKSFAKLPFHHPLQVTLSPNAKYLAVRGKDRIAIYLLERSGPDNHNVKLQHTMRIFKGEFKEFKWSPNSHSFFILSPIGTLDVYADVKQKKVTLHDVVSASFSPGKNKLGLNLLISNSVGKLIFFDLCYFVDPEDSGLRRPGLKLRGSCHIDHLDGRPINNLIWMAEEYVFMSLYNPAVDKKMAEESPGVVKVSKDGSTCTKAKVFSVLRKLTSDNTPRQFRGIHLDSWNLFVAGATDSCFISLFEEYQTTYFPLVLGEEEGDFDMDEYCHGICVDYTFRYPLDWVPSPILMFLNEKGDLHIKHLRYSVDEQPKPYPGMTISKKNSTEERRAQYNEMNKWLTNTAYYKHMVKHFKKIYSYAYVLENDQFRMKRKDMGRAFDYSRTDVVEKEKEVDSFNSSYFWDRFAYGGKNTECDSEEEM